MHSCMGGAPWGAELAPPPGTCLAVLQELILFSRADLDRSIPSMVDGLKPGQRKILFSCFKRNLKKDIKVRLQRSFPPPPPLLLLLCFAPANWTRAVSLRVASCVPSTTHP